MSMILLASYVWAYLLGPTHDGPGPKTRGEPGVEDVLVLLERELGIAGQLLRVGGRFLESTADDPVLTVVALHAMLINRLWDAIVQQLTSCS